MKNYRLYVNSWRFFLVVLLVMGVFFRFVNLDKKVYWIDEVHTAVRVSGYTRTEFVDQLSSQGVVGIADLQKYQRLAPDRGLTATLNALAGNAEHSPLYYLIARLGMQGFNDYNTGLKSLAPLQTRIVSAVISLFAFPCLYWLCWELFQSQLMGWLAMALMAVSPFHVLYAQEAREYSLWTVAILLSSASLLRVIKCQEGKIRVSNWVIYAITVAVGFYSHLLFGLVAVAHGIYVLVIERFRFSRVFISYLLASFAGILAFLPWLLVFVHDSDGIGGWVARKIPLLTLLKRWPINLSLIFFDVQIAEQQLLFDLESAADHLHAGYAFPWICLIAAILVLVGYSTYFLFRHTPKKTWLFIFLLTAVPALTLALPDLISGGQRSSTSRFLTPCYLGIQLMVTHLLAYQITSPSLKAGQQRLWQLILLSLISVGILSCAISSQAETWWTKYSSYYNPHIAEIINQSSNPLVISGAEKASRLTSLSYILDPKTRFLLVKDPKSVIIPEGFSDVFLFRPSTDLQQQLEQKQRYATQLIDPLGSIWRVKKSINF